MTLVARVRAAGVVGAGGGGFPTHVKLAATADTLIANGAECEPLLHKDAAVMEHHADEVIRGMLVAMDAVQAQHGIVGLKAKNVHAHEAMRAASAGTKIRIHLLGDYYPAGDEFDLVHEVTGRLIPPAGLPVHVGVVVCNVETFVNIARAADGRPVTHKTLTVAGAVGEPVTITVPLGTRFRDCIAAAGGATVADPVLAVGGLMMGETTDDLERAVTKTTGGLIVLPRDHRIIARRLTPVPAQNAIGRSACDQCRYCTEYCPRYLLGYAVQPHQVMRSLGFTGASHDRWNEWAALCCACGLCTLYACPEDLFPKEACDQARVALRSANYKWSGDTKVREHPLRDGRRVPIAALMRKMAVAQYAHPAPWRNVSLAPQSLHLPLKQSAGTAARPVVSAGTRVAAGQRVADVAEKELGTALHAPIAAQVTAVTPQQVTLTPS